MDRPWERILGFRCYINADMSNINTQNIVDIIIIARISNCKLLAKRRNQPDAWEQPLVTDGARTEENEEEKKNLSAYRRSLDPSTQTLARPTLLPI